MSIIEEVKTQKGLPGRVSKWLDKNPYTQFSIYDYGETGVAIFGENQTDENATQTRQTKVQSRKYFEKWLQTAIDNGTGYTVSTHEEFGIGVHAKATIEDQEAVDRILNPEKYRKEEEVETRKDEVSMSQWMEQAIEEERIRKSEKRQAEQAAKQEDSSGVITNRKNKYDWSNLPELMDRYNGDVSSIAKEVGCSYAGARNRIQKYLKQNKSK